MLKLGQGKPFSFLLESIEGGAIRGRYSIIGREPDVIWRCSRGGKVEINREAQEDAKKFSVSARAPLDDLRALLDECRIDEPDQPQPMAAGLFGYLGYDMVRYMEHLPDDKAAGIDVPEAILIRPTLLAIFDQIENKFTLVTPVWFDKDVRPEVAYKAAQARLQRALGDLQKPLPPTDLSFPRGRESSASDSEHMRPTAAQSETPHVISAQTRLKLDPRLRGDDGAAYSSNMTEAEYIEMVERSKEYIRAGDIFQVVLSQRFTLPFAPPPFSLYRAIRRMDPSPFLYFFDFGAFSVVGSSPEILVRVRDGKVTIRPIAGTRARNVAGRTGQGIGERIAGRSQRTGRTFDAAGFGAQRCGARGEDGNGSSHGAQYGRVLQACDAYRF